MNRTLAPMALVATLVLGALDVRAAAPSAYPSQGKILEQQSSDKRACRAYAGQQSGFDPSMPPPSANQRANYAQQQYSQGQYEAARDTYARGFAACMRGRGYSVR